MNNKRYFLYGLTFENRKIIENIFYYGIIYDTFLSKTLREIPAELYEKDLDYTIDLIKSDDCKLIFYLEIPEEEFKKDEETKIFLPKTNKDLEGNTYIDRCYIRGVKIIKTGKHILNPGHILLEMPFGVEGKITTKEEINRFVMKNRKRINDYAVLRIKLNRDLTKEYGENEESLNTCNNFLSENEQYISGENCLLELNQTISDFIKKEFRIAKTENDIAISTPEEYIEKVNRSKKNR